MNGRRPSRVILAAAAAVLLLAGCQLPGDNLPPPPANPTTGLTGAPADGAGSPVGGGLLHAGRGWTATGIVGVYPAAGSCHLRFTPAGEPLPDPRCTPGAADQAVTQQNLHTTVCREGGYTRTVRPPRAVTDAAKQKLLAAYGIARSHTHEYELDHFVGFGVRRFVRRAEPFPATERLVDAGRSTSEIAAELSLSASQVNRIRSVARQASLNKARVRSIGSGRWPAKLP